MSTEPNRNAKIGAASASQSRLQLVILAASVVVLLVLLVATLVVRSWTNPPDANLSSNLPQVLDSKFEDPAFRNDSSSDEMLAAADRELEKLLARFPDSPQTWNAKANRDYMVSDTMSAKVAWGKAVELQPSEPAGLFGLAMLAFEESEFEKSIAICETLQRTSPGNPKVPLLLADALLGNNQPELAVLALEQHIQAEQTSVQALEMLGTACLATRDYEKAANCFRQALEYAPESKDAHYGLGQAYLRLREPEQAKIYMDRFQEIANQASVDSADTAQGFVDRAYAADVASRVFLDASFVYENNGDAAEAEAAALKSYALAADKRPILLRLKAFYLSQGRNWAAVEVVEQLSELEPAELEHWLSLGALYAELSQPELAINAYRKAIDVDPNDARSRRAETIIKRLQ